MALTEVADEVLQTLIYEEIDGKPVYYRGYQKVLMGLAQPEEIMGTSKGQSTLVALIVKFLTRHVDDTDYDILFNELGLHLKKGSNFSADIAIYRAETAEDYDIYNDHYADTPPLVVIEVDMKADLGDFASPVDYYLNKTRKLLDWGTERVIWVNTQSQTFMGNDLKPISWEEPIDVLPGLSLRIPDLLRRQKK
ncbi:MAG: Uma2 family endonuclease [Sphingobacteriaceae bacterium]|nr:Uma2 family endonuclease [Cytophagaceae bacterium]